MKDNGVDFYFNDAIERIEGKKLIMKNGVNIEVDFIAASVGIIPNTALAAEAWTFNRSNKRHCCQ